MALYVYKKAPPGSYPVYRRNVWSVIPYLFVVMGIFIVGLVVYPFTMFERVYSNDTKLSDPGVNGTVLGRSTTNLMSASSWFPGYQAPNVNYPSERYFLRIPKLGIREAVVIVGSDDLSKSLIQFGGSAIPGTTGNTVIFGHSTLPQFFNPSDYTTIFAKLTDLVEGDEVEITYDNVTYRYVVYERVVVDPYDYSVLSKQNLPYVLSLVTCVPPGFNSRRLVVRARLLHGDLK